MDLWTSDMTSKKRCCLSLFELRAKDGESISAFILLAKNGVEVE